MYLSWRGRRSPGKPYRIVEKDMNVAIKRLSVAVTIILFSLQSAFAGNGKNPCTGDKQLNSSRVMNTPSAQNQPVSDLPRDDA